MATVIVLVVTVGVFAAIVYNEIKKYKSGKSGCGCCGNCSSCNICEKTNCNS